MLLTYDGISDWVQLDDDSDCSFRYILGTDPNDPKNRVAFIEMTPRVNIISKFSATGVDNRTVRFQDDIQSVWVYGYKGEGGFDEESREWCDNLLKALYPND